jgi:hypothetical protein
MDEIAKLRAGLSDLNLKCQTARDNEVRYALQRSRLEAERAELLVRLIEAMSRPGVPIVAQAPYHVTLGPPILPVPAIPVAVIEKPADKSAVRQSLPAAVLDALASAPRGLATADILAALRAKRPDVRPGAVYTVLCNLKKSGRTAKDGDRHVLAGAQTPPANGHAEA